MTRIAFSNYTQISIQQRSLEEAVAEVEREMQVRQRIYDDWLQKGRITWVDAHDRMERIISAMQYLLVLDSLKLSEQQLTVNAIAPATADVPLSGTTPLSFAAAFQLDRALEPGRA